MSKQVIYGQADIARELGVDRRNLVNWLARGLDVPPPDLETPTGTPFWTEIEPWLAWWDRWR